MATLDPEWWSAVSPYLDDALELPESERAAWISSIHDRDSAHAAHLRSLLDEHSKLAGEGFLENGPLPFPRPSISAGQRIGVYTLLSPHRRRWNGQCLAGAA